MDLNATMEMLVRDPAKYQPAFPYEREIRLYEFQTWIYFPEAEMEMVEMAGSLAAAKYLSRLECQLVPRTLRFTKRRRLNSTELKRLLNDAKYRELFDATIGEYGGWSELVRRLQRIDFGQEMYQRIKIAETVCQMIDYRFRYLDHGGTDKKEANISHGEFYRWKKKDPELSYKTIRQRWSQSKQSAVFLYVSEYLGLRLSPRFRRMGYFFGGLEKDAADSRYIRRFFGTCAYVSEKLQGDGDDTENSENDVRIPASLRRLRPKTEPLSQADRENMSCYKTERDEMRAS
jgi:hypothetical protein